MSGPAYPCSAKNRRGQIGAPHVKAPRPFLFGVWLEEELDGHLSDARIRRLSCAECTERVAAEFVEGSDVVRAVHGARTNALGAKFGWLKMLKYSARN